MALGSLMSRTCEEGRPGWAGALSSLLDSLAAWGSGGWAAVQVGLFGFKLAISWLCDLGQVTLPVWALLISGVKCKQGKTQDDWSHDHTGSLRQHLTSTIL